MAKTTIDTLSPKAVKKLFSPQVNLGDKLLYEQLHMIWWRQPVLKEDNFWEEVSKVWEDGSIPPTLPGKV